MRSRLIPVAVVAIAGIATAAVVTSGGSAQTPGPRTLTFTEVNKGQTFNAVDNPPLSRKSHGFPVSASPGDLFVFSTPLADQAGKPAGTLNVSCTAIKGNRNFERGVFLCNAVTNLTSGTITLEARAQLSQNRTTAAITGGTGAYDGARGTFISVSKGNRSTDTFQLLAG
jgi:hypothetical protein